MQLKEELKEAQGVGRIFDDSDKNRNQMGLLGTVLQTYFPRFFTPDDDDEDEDDDDDDDEDDDVEDKGAGNTKNSEVQPAASQKPAVASDGASNAADKKKTA